MKLYIITISDVYDFEGFHVAPIVKTSLAAARKELNRLYKSAKESYEGQYDQQEKSKDSFSLCPEGCWGTSHYDAVIDTVDVPVPARRKAAARR